MIINKKNITLLRDLDNKIVINKNGEFKHFSNFNFDIDNTRNFIYNLDSDKIYTVIPFVSVNNNINEPYTILSKQILITKYSNPVLKERPLIDQYFKLLGVVMIKRIVYFVKLFR
jgi:hypothetical protein